MFGKHGLAQLPNELGIEELENINLSHVGFILVYSITSV